MKKDASKLMTGEKFWEIIENSEHGNDLNECLAPLSEDELFGFRYWWEYFRNISYKQDLWAAAYIVLGGCSDDGFDYFCFWLIAQGRKVFYAAMENADSLCDVFSELAEEGESPENEDLDYAVQEVLGERSGDSNYFYKARENYLMPQNKPEIEIDWDEDDEESLRKICPRTFDKWWGNDEF